MSDDTHGQTNQPTPQANNEPAVWDLVIADIKARDQYGKAKYGVRLQPFNGRDVLRDAYEEALDLVVYLRQAVYEDEHVVQGEENILINLITAEVHEYLGPMYKDAASKIALGVARRIKEMLEAGK